MKIEHIEPLHTFPYTIECAKCGTAERLEVSMKRRQEEHHFACACGYINQVQFTLYVPVGDEA